MTEGHRRRRGRKHDDVTIDPTLQSLSHINGCINRMSVRALKRRLTDLKLNTDGVTEVLKKRLKSHYRKLMLPRLEIEGQYYPYMVVIDFEATCEENNPDDYVHEIIEFPAILIDTSTLTVIDEFHSYCCPGLHLTLSKFCKDLTGIEQGQVKSAPHFSQVFDSFETWLERHNIIQRGTCAFVTDGCWDFSRFLNVQCALSEISYPAWASHWINLKKIYGNFYKLKKPQITSMLTNVGMEFEGRLHCGMDDARNIARILIRLMQDGAKPQLNEKLFDGKLIYIRESERLTIAKKQIKRLNLKTIDHDVTQAGDDDITETSERLGSLKVSGDNRTS